MSGAKVCFCFCESHHVHVDRVRTRQKSRVSTKIILAHVSSVGSVDVLGVVIPTRQLLSGVTCVIKQKNEFFDELKMSILKKKNLTMSVLSLWDRLETDIVKFFV